MKDIIKTIKKAYDKENSRLHKKEWEELIKVVKDKQKEEIQKDIQSVLNFLEGETERFKIINFIKEYLTINNKEQL